MGRVSDAKERLLEAVTALMWENSYASATVEAICVRAGVKKGSFYYFFESKSDLAIAALEALWQRTRPELDRMFASDIPPLERMLNYFHIVYAKQHQCCREREYALGCPYFNVGTEICTQDAKILGKIRVILDHYREYFESAVRDAKAQGIVDVPDPAATARCLFSLYEGALTQARIHNNPELLRDLPAGALQLLGVNEGALGNRGRVAEAA